MLNRILTKLTALHEIHTTKKRRSFDRRLVLALSIFPGRCQPSIVDRNELNYRVRNGNGWTLILISTNYMSSSTARKQTILYCPSRLLSRHFLSGDPYRIRTDVNGVRGRCLNHLTNGPWCAFTDSNRGPSDYESVALPTELKAHAETTLMYPQNRTMQLPLFRPCLLHS